MSVVSEGRRCWRMPRARACAGACPARTAMHLSLPSKGATAPPPSGRERSVAHTAQDAHQGRAAYCEVCGGDVAARNVIEHVIRMTYHYVLGTYM